MNRKTKQYLIIFLLFSALLLICHVGIIQPPGIKIKLVPYDEDGCGCPRWASPISNTKDNSLCSDYSTSRGGDQKIVSYSIYGDPTKPSTAKKYHNQVQSRINEVMEYYKGWIVRLYYNRRSNDSDFQEFLCSLYCKNANLDPCKLNSIKVPKWLEPRNQTIDESKLPTMNLLNVILDWQDSAKLFLEGDSIYHTDFNIPEKSDSDNMFTSKLIGKMWRFLVMGDPLVSQFLIRDIDSYIFPREVMAVKQWLEESNAGFHGMRDHPSHNGVILAGMWGGSRKRMGSTFNKILHRMLQMKMKNTWDFDQVMLRRFMWPRVQDSILIHDSYHCRNPFLKARTWPTAFPTKRNGSLFVGWGPTRGQAELSGIKPCPVECRPAHHQDWKFC